MDTFSDVDASHIFKSVFVVVVLFFEVSRAPSLPMWANSHRSFFLLEMPCLASHDLILGFIMRSPLTPYEVMKSLSVMSIQSITMQVGGV